MKSLPLDGRAAIITGASEGLGREIARAYVRAGANVLLCARDARLLSEAGNEVRALASATQVVLTEPADVSRPDDVERLIGRALSAFPRSGRQAARRPRFSGAAAIPRCPRA